MFYLIILIPILGSHKLVRTWKCDSLAVHLSYCFLSYWHSHILPTVWPGAHPSSSPFPEVLHTHSWCWFDHSCHPLWFNKSWGQWKERVHCQVRCWIYMHTWAVIYRYYRVPALESYHMLSLATTLKVNKIFLWGTGRDACMNIMSPTGLI